MSEKREIVRQDPYVIRVPDPERGGTVDDLDLLHGVGFLGQSSVTTDPVGAAVERAETDYLSLLGVPLVTGIFASLGTAMSASTYGFGTGAIVCTTGAIASVSLGGYLIHRMRRTMRRIQGVPLRTSRIEVHPDSTDPLDAAIYRFTTAYEKTVKAGGRFTDYEAESLNEILLAAGRVAELRSVLGAATDLDDDDVGEHEDRHVELVAGEEAAIARLRDAIGELSSYHTVLTRSTKTGDDLPAFADFSDLAERSARTRRALARARELGTKVIADAEYERLGRATEPRELTP